MFRPSSYRALGRTETSMLNMSRLHGRKHPLTAFLFAAVIGARVRAGGTSYTYVDGTQRSIWSYNSKPLLRQKHALRHAQLAISLSLARIRFLHQLLFFYVFTYCCVPQPLIRGTNSSLRTLLVPPLVWSCCACGLIKTGKQSLRSTCPPGPSLIT